MARIILVWGLWGPYHRRRFEAFRDHARNQGHQVTGVSLFSGSRDYQWRPESLPDGVVHFDLGKDETKFPIGKIGSLLALPRKLRPHVALLPSYDHWSLALNAATRLSGGRVVMMNDTHSGTACARGLKAAFKRKVVAAFHAGFVAGAPQRRYFASLGLPSERIFTGYNAVDNDYFALKAGEIRERKQEVRSQYDLPERYFLSLGRFVAKKNLSALIRAYRMFLDSDRAGQVHLVMVGSGEEDTKLRSFCRTLRLPVYDKTPAGTDDRKAKMRDVPPGVHFYGFRQINENPVFYALAEAFILPSLREEWGLVVNEAMASGLPVIVSDTAGCVEDLLKPPWPAAPETRPTDRLGKTSQTGVRIRQNGCVFNPNSHESLAQALLVLAAAPVLREVMGKASRVIIGNFSCDVFARNALLAARAAMGEIVSVPPAFSPAEQAVGAASGLTS
jgi:glycosyltransferase involved in cell wall biosynthesis